MAMFTATASSRFASFVAYTAPRVFARPMVRQRFSSTASLTPPPSPQLSTYFENLFCWSTWFIKRTFQPSIIRKRRKTGLLTRNKSVGGRKILKRRKMKGRARLAGC